MTKQQAQAIYQLTATPQWAAFLEVQQERRDKLMAQFKDVSPDKLYLTIRLQGQIEEVEKVMKLRKDAEEVLNRQQA